MAADKGSGEALNPVRTQGTKSEHIFEQVRDSAGPARQSLYGCRSTLPRPCPAVFNPIVQHERERGVLFMIHVGHFANGDGANRTPPRFEPRRDARRLSHIYRASLAELSR